MGNMLGQELLQGVWVQEFSFSHGRLFSSFLVFNPDMFEISTEINAPAVLVKECLFIESLEYRAKHVLILLDSGHLIETKLRCQSASDAVSATDELQMVRSYPADGNIWNKHQGVIVCMRVVGCTLVTLGSDYTVRTWSLFSGLSLSRVIHPGFREGFSPVGMQLCHHGLVLASSNSQEHSNVDLYGACDLHLIDFLPS